MKDIKNIKKGSFYLLKDNQQMFLQIKIYKKLKKINQVLLTVLKFAFKIKINKITSKN